MTLGRGRRGCQSTPRALELLRCARRTAKQRPMRLRVRAAVGLVLGASLAGCGGADIDDLDAAMEDASAQEDAAEVVVDAGARDVGAPDAGSLDAAGDVADATRADATTDVTARDAVADVVNDAGAHDAGADVPVDAGPTLVAVSHEREFRGAWVATVYNIDWPSRTGLSMSAAQSELAGIVDVAERNGLNALVFQVRPEGDAFYRSTLEPWSRFLTGRQGGDPGWDPLEFLVQRAHARNIEVHAWFNPYRAKGSTSSTAVRPHISVTNPEAMVTYNGALWMDPSRAVVQDRTVAVIRDVVARYAVDGVHFDDYFYPYPQTGMTFGDSGQYDRYRSMGGTLSLGDWRRDNVNTLVRRVGEAVGRDRPDVRFGISPFGIYRPGMPAGITGLDAYAAIYCDAPLWMQRGWVDYLSPQLYWPSTQTAQAYGTLIQWWAGQTRDGRSIFAGNSLSRLGSTSAWTVAEVQRQVELTRAQRSRGARGNLFFTIDELRTNRMGVADMLRTRFYATPALTPPIGARRGDTVAPPTVSVSARTLTMTHAARSELRAWVVYRRASGSYTIDRIVPATTNTVTLPAGTWAVSAASRAGVESEGVVVTLR